MRWLRLWSDFATDPKVQRLPEAMQRRFVMLLCLACSRQVPTSDDDAVAFALRLNLEETSETKRTLMRAKLIGRDWKPCAWERRQRPGDHTAAERKRRQRAKPTVTDSERDVSRDSHSPEGRGQEGTGLDADQRKTPHRTESPMERIQRLNGGGTGRILEGEIVSPLKSPRSSPGSRRNGDFERINADVLVMVQTGGINPDDSDAISKALHITKSQAATAIEQLRDRGKLPRSAMRANA
jgi:hypothetical protein